MSDGQPERKEEEDAPEGHRKPYLRFIAWAILSFVLYGLSIGPMSWLEAKRIIPAVFLDAVYCPLIVFGKEFPAPLQQYISWWTPAPPAETYRPIVID